MMVSRGAMQINEDHVQERGGGGGLQCDALCNDGFTYTFHVRSDPPLDNYVERIRLPLHARMMWLFDSFRSKFHKCGMDLLYNLARFIKETSNFDV